MKKIKNMFKRVYQFLRTLHPRFWIMNYTYSKSWDNLLNEYLDKYEFDYDSYDGYNLKLGDLELWVANHPYASFNSDVDRRYRRRYRPSKKTILRIEDKIKEENLIVWENIVRN